MAAIFGVFATDPTIDLTPHTLHLQARSAYLAPHGFTRWQGEGAVLGHGALHVGAVPVQASQPLRLADGRICVADAYLSNFDELRGLLSIGPNIAVDDAQLLALAIERWGDAFTEHVHGEFSVALWCPQSRELALYCDHLGGRPLCYVQTPTSFAFASTYLALVGLPGVPARVNPLSIAAIWFDDASYLSHDYTLFEGVHAMQAARRLRWKQGGPINETRYWNLQPGELLRLHDEGEYVEAFREAFGGAVARTMRGSTKTALMLSGGIDSASILAARRGFKQGGVADDLLCISAVLAPDHSLSWLQSENRNILDMTEQHPHTLQFRVPVDDAPGSLVTSADLAEAAWSWIHPADTSLLVPSLACSLAKKNGCRLVLNGVDGDNLTAPGGNHLALLLREGKLRRAWSESVRASQVNTYLRTQAPSKLFARGIVAAMQPEWLACLRQRRQAERDIYCIDDHPDMAPELAQITDLPARLRHAVQLRTPTELHRRGDHLAYWLAFSLGGSHGIVSRHGLESRHPWCDWKVLEFFQRLPTEFRVRHGWTKWVVRQACEPALGARVVWHSGKNHLGTALNAQVLADAAPYLMSLLGAQRPRLREYVRDEAINRAIGQLSKIESQPLENCGTLLIICSLAGLLCHVHEHLNQEFCHA